MRGFRWAAACYAGQLVAEAVNDFWMRCDLDQRPGKGQSRCVVPGDQDCDQGVSHLAIIERRAVLVGGGEQVVEHIFRGRSVFAAASGRDESEKIIVQVA